MKITIIHFSPSGYTQKVTFMLEKELKKRGQDVQLVEMKGNEDFFIRKDFHGFLKKNIQQHDVLLIGGPVYTHHLQYHIQNLIQSLPKPDYIWGKYVIPYICYGGISSGIALKEAADLLKRTGRVVYAGMKVSAPHSMTRAFMDEEFNRDKLQDQNFSEITELVDRIMKLNNGKERVCNAKHLNYNGIMTFLKAKIIFKEKLWHEKRYPQISIDKNSCTNCGKCIKLCPVLHLIKKDGVVVENNQSSCIHCFNCVTDCPSDAIKLIGDMEKGQAFMRKMIAKNGNKESPETAIYPLF